MGPRDPVQRQIALNRSVADHWELFAEHRRRVTDLLVSGTGHAPRPLYVLGAGNCNDLDLRRLTGTFDEIHLADLDVGAVRSGIRRQSPRAGVIWPHRVDLSGIADPLRRWSSSPPSNVEIDRTLVRMEHEVFRRWPRRATAGVAVSTGLLSQMTAMAVRALGADHPRAVEVALAIRDAHLRHIVRMLAPSGRGVVVTDIASWGPGGALEGVAPVDLDALAERLAGGGLVTTGTNPLGILASLAAQDRPAAIEIARHRPWVWNLTPTEPRLVVAISFRRASEEERHRGRPRTVSERRRHPATEPVRNTQRP